MEVIQLFVSQRAVKRAIDGYVVSLRPTRGQSWVSCPTIRTLRVKTHHKRVVVVFDQLGVRNGEMHSSLVADADEDQKIVTKLEELSGKWMQNEFTLQAIIKSLNN